MGGGAGPQFDAYCATVYAHPQLVLGHLLEALSEAGHVCHVTDGPPIRFYASNTLLVDGDGHRLVQIRHGGQNLHPFVECKGALSGAVASNLRRHLDHAPSRLDSAYDLHGPDAFEQAHAIAQRFEKERGVVLDYAGAAVEHPDRGTTIYLGSRKSQAFVRIYQKGLKLAQEQGLSGDKIPEWMRNWVRIELEYKPYKRRARMIAATLSPQQLWGCSPWTQAFAMDALAINAERFQMNERRESSHDRAMRALVDQYGPTILRQVERLGSWERFALDLQERLGLLEPAH